MDPHDADKQESTHSSSGFRNQSESTRNGDILRRMPPVSASTVTSFDDSGPSSLDGKEYSAGEVKFMYKDKKLVVSANILINCDEEKRRYTQQLSIPLDASFDKSEEAVGVHVAKAFAQTMQGMSHALQNQVQPKPISHKGYLTDRIVPIHTGRYEDEFEEMGSIGKGGFATVTKAKHRIDEQCYAIKRIPLKTSKDMGQEKEATILARLTKESLNCDSIVRYHNAWLEEVWKRPRQSSGGCSTSVRQIEASSSFSDSSSEDEFSQSKSTRLKSLEWKNSSKEESSHSIVFKDSSKRSETVIHSNTSSSKTKSTKFELLNEAPVNGIYTSVSSSEKFQYRETREILSNSTSRKKERSKKLWIKQNNNYEEQQLRGMKPLTRMVLYIQMELCGKTLSDWLTERNEYKESEDCFSRVECTTNTHIIRQILEGLSFIHRHDILHRDLKPLNVFLSEPHLNVKIGDFGLAREVIMESETLASGPGRGLNGQPQLSSEVGTTLYTAPEQKKGGSYDHKADMFSLGIISYELFHPFRTGHERINCITKLKEGVLPEEIEERWAKEAEMIKNLTLEEKGRRPSADDLLRNDLFQVDGAIKEEKLRHLEETNKKQEMEIKRTSSMYELKEKELKQENQELMERNRALEERLKEKQKELQQERVQRDEEMGKIKKEMKQKIQQMRKKEQDLRKKDQEMKRKDEELVELRKEVRRMRVSSDSSCRDSVSSVDIDDSLEE